MKIKLKYNEILAALLFASKDATRYVLDSVLVEMRQGQTRLIGCDGRRLAVILSESESVEPPIELGKMIRVILPRALIMKARPKAKIKEAEFDFEPTSKLESSITDGQFKVTINDGEFCTVGRSVLGNYPNYEQVITDVKGGAERLCLNASLARSFEEANALLAGKKGISSVVCYIADSKTSAIRVVLGNAKKTFIGIIMPCYDDGFEAMLPNWFLAHRKVEPVAPPTPAKEATP